MKKYTYDELSELAKMRAEANIYKENEEHIIEYMLEKRYNIEDMEEYILNELKFKEDSYISLIWGKDLYIKIIFAITPQSAINLGMMEYDAENIAGTYIEMHKTYNKSTVYRKHSFTSNEEIYDEYIELLHEKINHVLDTVIKIKEDCLNLNKTEISEFTTEYGILFHSDGDIVHF